MTVDQDRDPISPTVPSSIVFLKNLKTLSLGGCKPIIFSLFVTSISESYRSGFIKKLDVSCCNLSEEEFPGDLSALFSLEDLNLSYNPFMYLPHSISQLPRLKILDVSECNNLEKLQGLPSSIAVLHARACPRLTSFFDFTKYETLWKLSMSSIEGGWENSVDSVLQSLLQGHLVANHRFGILVPGSNIPKWFSQQNEGYQTNLQLPSGWSNGNILGFAICAVINNYADHTTIRFDMMEGKMQNFKLTLPETPNCDGLVYKKQVWLGFLSFDSFKLLFPQIKDDGWSKFVGSLCKQMYHDNKYCMNYGIAIRLVYKYDLKEGTTTIQNSAAATGQPWLKYADSDDEDEERDVYSL